MFGAASCNCIGLKVEKIGFLIPPPFPPVSRKSGRYWPLLLLADVVGTHIVGLQWMGGIRQASGVTQPWGHWDQLRGPLQPGGGLEEERTCQHNQDPSLYCELLFVKMSVYNNLSSF